MIRSRIRAVAVALLIAAGLVGVSSASGASAQAAAVPVAPAARAVVAPVAAPVCGTIPAPAVAKVAPDTRLDAAFDRYADRQGASHWTGADSTYSAPLPGGRDLWIFSDTFLGTVKADGSRSPVVQDGGTTPFVNNTFVTAQGGRMSTVTGGTPAQPTALLPPPDADHWYWARDGKVLGGRLNVVYSEFKRTGTGPLDFGWDRNVLARFSLGRLNHPASVTPLPSAADISWGAWLLRDAGYTYVYGSEDLGPSKYMHLARVHGTDLTAPWQYLAANGTWSPAESSSARVQGPAGGSADVSNEFSVVRHGALYVLVSQDMSQPLSAGITLSYSCSPGGPFVDPDVVYTTPETGPLGSYKNPNVYTYNPHEHPELGSRDELVISYNVNSFTNTDLYKDASIYRPRFVTVRLR